MPNIKISAAADAGTLLSSDMIPLARSGNTNAYHATMTEIATFTNASLSSGAYGNVGRNLVHNPLFNVQQRGTGAFTANAAFTADRWKIGVSGSTISVTVAALSDTNRADIGDEAAQSCLTCAVTGTSGAADNALVTQAIENVRRLAGKTVTLSFYANSATASLKIGVSLDQYFGSGGSPSATVTGTGQAVTLSATAGQFARYSLTFTLSSVSGKTLGTNSDHSTLLNLWFSSGSTNNARAGNIGVQSGTFNLWGVQLEIGSTATPLEKPDAQQDLARCQRFYTVLTRMQWGGYAVGAGYIMYVPVSLPVGMRATPSVSFANASYTGGSGVAAVQSSAVTVSAYFTANAAGQNSCTADFIMAADL